MTDRQGYVRSRVLDEIRLAKQGPARPARARRVRRSRHARHQARRRHPLHPIVNWLAGFGRDLTARHPDVPEVASFREQARDYVRKAAPARSGDL